MSGCWGAVQQEELEAVAATPAMPRVLLMCALHRVARDSMCWAGGGFPPAAEQRDGGKSLEAMG